jgi:hypothetical protein
MRSEIVPIVDCNIMMVFNMPTFITYFHKISFHYVKDYLMNKTDHMAEGKEY